MMTRIPIFLAESFDPRRQRLQKQQAKAAPAPLSHKRRRSLTPPLPTPTSRRKAFLRKKQITHEQLQSVFFKLPLELREIIYEEVFCAGNPDFIVTVLSGHKRQCHICGRARDWGEAWSGHREDTSCTNHADHGLLALLRTCRVIYTEAVDILYSKPTFLFEDPQEIVRFTRTILPRRLHTIRSLELAWDGIATRFYPGTHIAKSLQIERDSWDEAWKIMAGMEGLRELSVRLKTQSIISVLGPASEFVQQMKRVTGTKVKLILPLEDFEQFDSLEDGSIPFELVEETMLEEDRWFFSYLTDS